MTEIQRLKLADIQEQLSNLEKLEKSSRADIKKNAFSLAADIKTEEDANKANIKTDEPKNKKRREEERKITARENTRNAMNALESEMKGAFDEMTHQERTDFEGIERQAIDVLSKQQTKGATSGAGHQPNALESKHKEGLEKIIDGERGEFDRLAKEQALPKKQNTGDASSKVDKNVPSARAVGDRDRDSDNDSDNDNDTSTTGTTYCPVDPKPDIDSAKSRSTVPDDNEVQSTKVEDNHKLTQVELDEKILVVMKAAVAAAKKSYGRSWTGTTKEEDLQKLINAYANKINGAVELRSEQDILKEFIQKASEPRKVMGLFDMGKAELGDTASAKAFYRALDDESLRKRFTDMLGLAELAAPDGKNQQEFITKVVNKVSPPSAPTQGLTGPGSSSGS